MSDSQLTALLSELERSLSLIDESKVIEPADPKSALPSGAKLINFSQPDSLLAKCDQVCAKYQNDKPVLRVIHHLACSGGSLISKCFSAMPNAFLLSEVHPHSYRHLPKNGAQFLPSDIATLAKQANFPHSDKLAKKIFTNAITATYEHVSQLGGILILRDHSHSDFCVGDKVATSSTVVSTLEQQFDIQSIATLRNPIDAYASLKKNWWLHFQPDDFDSYCDRVLKFLSQFEKSKIFFYEDFVNQPQQELANMCETLDLPFYDDFQFLFDVFNVTGDSGRKGNSITPRKRRDIEPELKEQIVKSSNFKLLCEQYHLDYFPK
ncbi:hypothetical protein [Shewanella youngdeokensis]|uniref:Sulfotransferase family protein n=1 Tax=Shewanella youngdeokensis TaxID=2999068 RepID=A0ABZ0K3G5_9GAMM|nr:hypothetical protein RGE70_05710 [Shewanella sp. DAU334]